MGSIWVRQFTGGLDTRRLPETTPGGALIKGNDGHITPGGEFEKRPAFVETYDLPAGTIGLSHDKTGLITFGSDADPGVPSGMRYQQLQHPDGSTEMTALLCTDLYSNKIYAAAQFADGTINHYYDAARVTAWFDGRARASFSVIGGAVTPAVKATGSFDVTGGTLGSGHQITSVKINGVDILTGPIAHTGSNDTTASAIATAINTLTSSPDYTATVSGATVTVTAAVTGTAANGLTFTIVVGGDATVGNIVAMQGGADAITSMLSDLKVNGVSIISAPVSWGTSNEATATAIASAVNSDTSSPDYSATAVGAQVNVIAAAAGSSSNGYAVTFTLTNGLVVTPTSLSLANGSDDSSTYTPGGFIRTIGSKIYAPVSTALHFSGIQAPTKFSSDVTGAGFIDMSQYDSESNDLVAVSNYQSFIAVFAGRTIQIWYVDPDPSLNRKSQVLKNTGTESPRSVTEVGTTDVYYLDESGVRSLRSVTVTGSVTTEDIGTPINTLVTAALESFSETDRLKIIGLVNPVDGRFWLILGDTILVFSYFPDAKISAWTQYLPGFTVEDATVWNRRVYVRSGDKIYAFGGTGATTTYDATVAEAHLPYLDGGQPTQKKTWTGIDVAVSGTWSVAVGMDPVNIDTEDAVATPDSTTYGLDAVPFSGSSTHASIRFRSQGTGPAKFGAAVLHYDGDLSPSQ